MDGDTVNLFVNSPGGSVFVAVAMTSEIRRAIQRGVNVNAYVDGIAASAASFLIMACDTVNMYQGTMLMLHKPMSICIGNADDMMKTAEDLEAIQEGTCMPLYRSKLKATEDELVALVANETWLSAGKAAEIFNISIIDEQKDVRDSIDPDVIAKYGYSNVPKQLLKPVVLPTETPEREVPEPEQTQPTVDYTEWEERIKKFF
jgi:ATP-dependent protease ClpP protease subunit